MAKKKSQNVEGEKKTMDEPKNNNKKEDAGKKKDSGSITVILRVDLHCDGCATKVIKSIRSFEGVESVKRSDDDKDKLSVVGKVDPMKLRENVEQKTKKQVVLISPLPKKDKDKGNDNQKDTNDGDGAAKKSNKKNEDTNKEEKKSKDKEPPVTTAVMKVFLHCEGCIQKIHKLVTKTKGYHEITIDRQNDLVTVKGSMEMKALAESLERKLKKNVEIVPPKKDKDSGGGGGGSGGNAKGKGGGGKPVEVGGGDGGEKMDDTKIDGNKMQYQPPQYPYPPPQYPYPHVYEPGYMASYHAPQMFSDENPNACSVM